jgi:hypothetical protein
MNLYKLYVNFIETFTQSSYNFYINVTSLLFKYSAHNINVYLLYVRLLLTYY